MLFNCILIPLYWLKESFLGPRELVDVTSQYPKRSSMLEAVTLDQGKLTITCTEHHHHVYYARFGVHRRYTHYHVCAIASGEVSETFKSAADFCVYVPATYPHALNPHHSERAAVDFYLDTLKSRMPETPLYRAL